MKAKVLKPFIDQYSGEVYKAGDILTISRERYEEILKTAPLVEEIKKPKKAKKTNNAAE